MGAEFDVEAARAANRCPQPGHHPGHVAGCESCKAYLRWWGRVRRAGLVGFIPAGPARAKVRKMIAAGLNPTEVARCAGVNRPVIVGLLKVHRRKPVQQNISPRIAAKILAADVTALPLADRTRVDATGTQRRLDCMALRGLGNPAVASRLGYNEWTVRSWRRAQFVTGVVAADVKALYEQTLNEQGPSPRDVIANARENGALPDRVWTAENIDDPGYDPLQILDEPIGVRRRLRALARDRHGAAAIAAMIGEDAAVVEAWTLDGPVPVYAVPLVHQAFERLGVGDDVEAADRAIHLGWAPAAAWLGRNIDKPDCQPAVAAKWGRRRTDVDPDYVNGALSGVVPRSELTKAELLEVLRRLGRTMTGLEVARHLQWGPDLDKAEAAVISYASNNGVALRDSDARRAARARTRSQQASIAA